MSIHDDPPRKMLMTYSLGLIGDLVQKGFIAGGAFKVQMDVVRAEILFLQTQGIEIPPRDVAVETALKLMKLRQGLAESDEEIVRKLLTNDAEVVV